MEVCTAVILNSVHFSDTQKIIHVYSKERGCLSLITPNRLFRRKESPAHLLQLSEITYLENGKSDLHRLQSLSPLTNLSGIYFDIAKMNIVLLWGEVLNLLLRKEGPNGELFNFISGSVEYLNTLSRGAGNFNLFFLYRLAGFIGYRINWESWQEGSCFHPADASFTTGTEGTVSGPNTARIIHDLCSCRVEDSVSIPLNRDARNILLDIVFLYYRLHLNVRFDIRSIEVIREVFR